MKRLIVLSILVLAGPAPALNLALPLDCALGEDCYVQFLVDRDLGPGIADFDCGSMTYDGHNGVDIALPTLADMEAGVAVIAAADGSVVAIRDGMPDQRFDPENPGSVEGRECGNGMVIDHGDGWRTQYCHLARGSVSVAAGGEVRAGDRLGRVGLSGKTEFPHLHFVLRKDGTVVDPFDGTPAGQSCTARNGGTPLWNEGIPFSNLSGGIASSGFWTAVPDYAEILARDVHRDPTPTGQPLVHWALHYGLEEGDIILIRILAPDGGELLADRFEMTRNRVRQFRAAGRRAPSGGWPAGRYHGISELIRDGKVIATRARDVMVE